MPIDHRFLCDKRNNMADNHPDYITVHENNIKKALLLGNMSAILCTK